MPIFTTPDRTQLPKLTDSYICNGLEALTGADIAISQFPLPVNENNLAKHIAEYTLFVQIKIGYDILSFDALRNFAARVQKCQIPKGQAILLRIGEYREDENGLFRIKGYKPYGDTKWNDYQRLLVACDVRGLNVVPSIRAIDELPQWIENRLAVNEKVEAEGKRDLYPPRVPPIFEPDDIWQKVEEVDANTWEYLLCAGLKGFGQKTVQNIRTYLESELPHIPPSGIAVLKVLTDANEKGKAIHEVKGWGDGKRTFLRDILGLFPGGNVDIRCQDTEIPYRDGWEAALKTLKEMIDSGHSVKDAFNSCVKMSKDLIEF